MGLKAYLNGIEFRMTDRYSIREQVGQPSSSTIEVKLDNNDLPVTHTRVEIQEDGATFYTGLISSVETPMYSTKFETDVVPLQVLSMDTIFTRRLVSGAFTQKYTHEIVNEIFSEYLLEEGLTLGNVEEFDRLYADYIVPNLRLSDVFQELGDEVGAVARISVDNVFTFETKNSFPSVEPPTNITKLKKTESGQDLKTVQRVSGAKAETSIQSEVIIWATGQNNALLGYQVAQEPSITINSAVVGVGLIGIDENNADKTFLWAVGNNAIVVNENATVLPVAGDTVSVLFRGYYNIDIITENEELRSQIASISGTSGKIESIIIDTSITDPQDGFTLGDNLLNEKSQREITITLLCHDIEKSSLLNSWFLNYPDLNIEGTFVVVERSIRDFYDDEYRVDVKLKNRGFYSRYGQSFNQYNKEINNLSIRTDDLVVKTSSIYETIQMEDEVTANQLFMIFTPGTTDIFSPVFFEGITPAGGV